MIIACFKFVKRRVDKKHLMLFQSIKNLRFQISQQSVGGVEAPAKRLQHFNAKYHNIVARNMFRVFVHLSVPPLRTADEPEICI